MNAITDAERSVFDADDARCQALMDNDLEALAQLMADDIIYTHSSATVENKDQYLESLRSGRLRYRSVQRKNEQLRVFGQVAVMHGRAIMQVDINGQTKDLNNLFQSVWVERDGRWELASWASTVIPPQAKV